MAPVNVNDTVTWAVNGQADMLTEGVRALEALAVTMDSSGDQELAEFRLYENLPIEAVVMDEFGLATTLRWNRREWVEVAA